MKIQMKLRDFSFFFIEIMTSKTPLFHLKIVRDILHPTSAGSLVFLGNLTRC